jgi:exopolysaccharide biosynthesis WecB/TagA/CpsF family protein
MRILCVQLADIGDLVLTTPALRLLYDSLPSDASVTLLTTPHAAPIIPPTGLVNHIIAFPKHVFDRPLALANPLHWGKLLSLIVGLQRGQFDAVIFFHHFSTPFGALKFSAMSNISRASARWGLLNPVAPFLTDGIPEQGFGALHQAQYWIQLVEAFLQRYGITPQLLTDYGQTQTPSGFIPAAVHVAAADNITANTLVGESAVWRVAIHGGSGGYSTARRWEPEKFASVAARLIQSQGMQVILVGGKGDDNPLIIEQLRQRNVPLQNLIDLTGKTTLGQLAAVLNRCDLFIGADSGVMHIAAAVGIPIVSVFGPSNASAWSPWTPIGGHQVIRNDPTCSPCSYVGTGVGQRDGCPARTCIRTVKPETVYKAAIDLLEHGTSALPPPSTPPPKADIAAVNILGVPVHKLTYDLLLDQVDEWIQAPSERLRHLCTVNPEFVMIAQNDPNFYNILNRADLCLADGVGIVLAARFLGDELPTRVTGSDGVPLMAERAAQHGWKIFMLGAWEGVAARAADELRLRYPGVQIVGIISGSPRPDEEDKLVEAVNDSEADILWVAYGAPTQDKWIARNAHRLNVAVAMGVGGTFDYLAGEVPIAPNWMRRAGLEWLYRLIRQPWRLRRQLRLPLFVWRVIAQGRDRV